MSGIVRYFDIVWNRRLGAGGEGQVFLARSVTSGTLYAAKFPNALLPALAQLNLQKELGRVLRVHGEYVARPVAWSLGHQPFVIYEYAEFGSLRDEMNSLRSNGQVYHPAFALFRIHQMLCGIRDAHRCGLVHRDVKPENFLLYSGGRLKLNDFGLGRTLNRAPQFHTTGFVGTPGYAAPEQWEGIRIDGRADIYSVGVVLYEMLVGQIPDRRTSCPLPSRYHKNILPSLDALCRHLLQWQRHERPQTVDQALNEVWAVRQQYAQWRDYYVQRGWNSPY